MVCAAPPLRERAFKPGRTGVGDEDSRGFARGDGGGEGMPVPTSNAPPRPACPAGGVVEALECHQGSVDGVGAGLDVAAGGDFLSRLVVITTTTFGKLIGKIGH